MLIKTEERQTYSYVAGIDTKSKTPQAFSKLLAEVFERIISSRDSLSIEKLKKFISNTYTIEFRQYLYMMFKESDLKPALIKRAKIILLD